MKKRVKDARKKANKVHKYKDRAGKLRSHELKVMSRPFVLSLSDGLLFPMDGRESTQSRPDSARSYASSCSVTSTTSLVSLSSPSVKKGKLPSIQGLGRENGYDGFWNRMDQRQERGTWLDQNKTPGMQDRITLLTETPKQEKSAYEERTNTRQQNHGSIQLQPCESPRSRKSSRLPDSDDASGVAHTIQFKHYVRRKSLVAGHHTEDKLAEIMSEHQGNHSVSRETRSSVEKTAAAVVTAPSLVLLVMWKLIKQALWPALKMHVCRIIMTQITSA